MSRWIPASPGSDVENLDGVWWFDAPVPARKHEHAAQTRGWRGFEEVTRCACGAFGGGYGPWVYLDEPRVLPSPLRRLWDRLRDAGGKS